MTSCTCTIAVLDVEGKRVEGVDRLDPDCHTHGLHGDWPAGHPLRRHALLIDPHDDKTYTQDERARMARVAERLQRLRLETPRETEQRLRSEAA